MQNEIDNRLTFGQFLAAILLGPAGIVRRHVAALWHGLKYGWNAYLAHVERHDPLLPTGIDVAVKLGYPFVGEHNFRSYQRFEEWPSGV